LETYQWLVYIDVSLMCQLFDVLLGKPRNRVKGKEAARLYISATKINKLKS
jgi:hypothetical protein